MGQGMKREVDGEDELAIFGGQMRVLARKSKARRPQSSIGVIGGVGLGNSTSASPPKVATKSNHGGLPPDTGSRMDVDLEELGPQRMVTTSMGLIRAVDFSSRVKDPLLSAGGFNIPMLSTLTSETRATPGQRLESITTSTVPANPIPSIPSLTTVPSPTIVAPLSNAWRATSPDVDGLPKVDTSFGWVPPPERRSMGHRVGVGQVESLAFELPSNHLATTPQSRSEVPPSPTPSLDFDVLRRNDPVHAGSQLPSSASPVACNSDQESTPMTLGSTDPAAMLVELGLMTESEIDSGWFSFIQDCGIMDESGT